MSRWGIFCFNAVWTSFVQAPVPLSIFRSNSKFDENSKHSSVKYTWLITTIFCTRHDSVTVVTCAKYRCDRRVYSKLEHSEFSSNFKFNRNMLSGTGARSLSVNSLWPCDAIWHHRSGLTLAQVMACCLTMPSHYLNSWRFLISEVLWYSPENNFIASAKILFCIMSLKFIYIFFKLLSNLPGASELNEALCLRYFPYPSEATDS